VIIEGKRPQLPAAVPQEVAQLATDCWQQGADARPSFEHVVARLEQLLAGSPQPVSRADQTLAGFTTDF
jgi:hypothetical protein